MSWWKPWTAWVAIGAGLVVLLVARALVRPGGDDRPGVAVALIVLNLATVGVVLLTAAVQRRPVAADFGLVRPPLRRAVTGALAVVAAMFVASVLSSVALGGTEDPVTVIDRLGAESSALNAVLVLVLVAVATPLAEEFLFRAYAFRALLPWRGPAVAAVISATVFTLFHLDWAPSVAFPTIALFGLATCWLYVRTSSLYPSLAAHALLNSVSLASLFDGPGAVAAVVGSVGLTLAAARLLAALLGTTGRPATPARVPQPVVANRSTIS